MNNPLSGARPLRITSPKESCPLLAYAFDLEGGYMPYEPHEPPRVLRYLCDAVGKAIRLVG